MIIRRGHPLQHLKSIRSIFFESSSRTEFADESEKERFFQRWTEYYLSEYPDWVYLAFDDANRVLGYLMGCPESLRAVDHYRRSLKSYLLFADLFESFPAHLHINLASQARGQGIGGRLIETFVSDLRPIPGVHIVTFPQARNRGFYLKSGFQFLLEREQDGRKFLFMGRQL